MHDPSSDTDYHPVGSVLPLPLSRELFFTKQVDQASIAELSKQIIEINKNDSYLRKLYPVHGLDYNPRPIKIYIDSYGGSVYNCFGLLSLMDTSSTPIHTFVTGTAMSAGFMIGIHGHKRFCYEHSTVMYHQVASVLFGKIQDMVEDIEEIKRLQNVLMDMVCKKTKIPMETILKNLEIKKDWFLDASDALKFGVVDHIIK